MPILNTKTLLPLTKCLFLSRWLSTWLAWISTTPTARWDTATSTWEVPQLQVQHTWQPTFGNDLTHPKRDGSPISQKQTNMWEDGKQLDQTLHETFSISVEEAAGVKIWETTTTSLSLLSLPKLPLAMSSIEPWSAEFHVCLQDILVLQPRKQGSEATG